jgi:WhiB family redox-sensing transcriptional regulator
MSAARDRDIAPQGSVRRNITFSLPARYLPAPPRLDVLLTEYGGVPNKRTNGSSLASFAVAHSLDVSPRELDATEPAPGWQARAACRDAADLFVSFAPHEGVAAKREREAAAKRVCASCPVVDECLLYALRVQEPLGIWGGLTAKERRAQSGVAKIH